MNCNYLSKADFLKSQTNNLYSNKDDNLGEKIVYGNNRFYKVKTNKEVNLSNIKIPEIDEKSNLVKQINKTKNIIDKYDKFFKEFEIEGKYTKKKIIKEQVTLENFNNKTTRIKTKTEKNNKHSEIIKSLIPKMKSNFFQEKKDFNYIPSLTEETKTEKDTNKIYYIKKINMDNYKKLFNIGDTEQTFIENINYLETLPEKNVFVNTLKTDNFAEFSQASNFFESNNGKFFNRNLAYGNDESAFMAKLMLKMELKKINNDKNKKKFSKISNKKNYDNTTILKSENSTLNIKNNQNTNKQNENNFIKKNWKRSNNINLDNNKEKDLLNNFNTSKLNNSNDNSKVDNQKIRSNYYYEKYSRNEIKETDKNIIKLPKINYGKIGSDKNILCSNRMNNSIILSKNDILINEAEKHINDKKSKQSSINLSRKNIIKPINKMKSESSLRTFNSEHIIDNDKSIRLNLNSTKDTEIDSILIIRDYKNKLKSREKMCNILNKEKEIWTLNEFV